MKNLKEKIKKEFDLLIEAEMEKQLEAEQSDKLKLEDFLPTFEEDEDIIVVNQEGYLIGKENSIGMKKLEYQYGNIYKTEKEAIYFSRRSIVLRLVDRMMLEFNVGAKPSKKYIFYNHHADFYNFVCVDLSFGYAEPYFYYEKDAKKCLEFLKEQEFKDGSKYIDYLILKNPLT